MLKRLTIFLALLFWIVFWLSNVLDSVLSGRLFYQPIIGILPFVLLIAWSGWLMARYASQSLLLVNGLTFSFLATIPFFLWGIQDPSTWRLEDQALTGLQDFLLLFIGTILVGEIRLLFFHSALPTAPASSHPATPSSLSDE